MTIVVLVTFVVGKGKSGYYYLFLSGLRLRLALTSSNVTPPNLTGYNAFSGVICPRSRLATPSFTLNGDSRTVATPHLSEG